MPKICLMCGKSFPDTTTFCPTDGSALRAAVQGDDLIGELVAERYLITDLISQGGMGAVYLASDVRLPQQFAIKVLKQQQTQDPSLIQRFRQEAEAVCRINHDRVARVFDFGFMPDDRAYIVMEYVAGKTLRQVVEARGPLDPLDAAKIMIMAAEGIDAAHRLGIVHRDLKPENVMILDDPGGSVRVKVLDFGIAKLKNTDADQGYTQPGFVIGTPAWMSPEQLLGEPLDPRSDVYALGLVAFALLTGERPFTGANEQAEMMARISVPARSLAEVRPDVQWPGELLRLFERTLSRAPAERPATAGQFAQAMMNAIAGAARPRGTTPMSTASLSATSSFASGATGDARTDSPLGAAAMTSSAGGASAAGTTSQAAPTKKSPLLLGIGAAAVLVVAAGAWWQMSRGGAEPAAPTVAQDTSAAPLPDTSRIAVGDPLPDTTLTDTATAAPPGQMASTNPPPGTTTGSVGASPAAPVRPPASPGTAPAPVAGRDKELQKLMDEFDKDSSLRRARETAQLIELMYGRLRNVSDQAWAQMYLGKAYLEMEDKEKACAAFERAAKIGAAIELVRKDSEDYRLVVGCRPQ